MSDYESALASLHIADLVFGAGTVYTMVPPTENQAWQVYIDARSLIRRGSYQDPFRFDRARIARLLGVPPSYLDRRLRSKGRQCALPIFVRRRRSRARWHRWA